MKIKLFPVIIFLCSTFSALAQKNPEIKNSKNSIPPVGIIKNISDSALLDIVQRQTFRYFWHFAHPVSGLARERDNTVKAEYFWDYADEAYGNVNLSTNTYGPEACAIGGTGFGIMATI